MQFSPYQNSIILLQEAKRDLHDSSRVNFTSNSKIQFRRVNRKQIFLATKTAAARPRLTKYVAKTCRARLGKRNVSNMSLFSVFVTGGGASAANNITGGGVTGFDRHR